VVPVMVAPVPLYTQLYEWIGIAPHL